MSLTLPEYSEAKGLPLAFLETLGVKQEATPRGPRIVIPYYGEDGREIAMRYRYGLNGKRFSWPEGTKPDLYGLDQLPAARAAGRVVIVEGESDVQTLRLHNIPALGVPGAPSGWNERYARHFDGVGTIYLIVEPDKAGAALLAKIMQSSISDRVRIVVMPMSEKEPLKRLKDPSALWLDNPDYFADRFEAALREAENYTDYTTVPKGSGGSDDTESSTGGTVANNPPTVELAMSEEPGTPSRYSGTAGTIAERDAILKRIAELRKFDEAGARVIIAEVVKAGFSSLMIDTLIKPLAEALGVKERAAKQFWQAAEAEVRAAAAEAAKANEEATAEKRARLEGEDAERRRREIAEEHERLWRSCKEIAESPTLLADMEALVHRHGVVGEGASVRGAYLTASSRLNNDHAICLLRRGAPAGGKNFLIAKMLALVPADSVIHMSSGSPLSLVYYGGGDEDALKHKIVYVPEAAIIAEKNGIESPLTVMLRLLISEGRLDHNVALPQSAGPPVTIRIKRNGPVVVIATSARDNVEEELLTRLMTSDADERPEQTLAVLTDALSVEDRDVGEAEVERWLDFQRWLMIDAPYSVVIPFRQAILAAYTKRLKAMETRGEKPNVQLRLRRDVHGFMAAIKTSAILHKAQRETDAKGRIIATIDDYRHAHEAFDEGLARLYKIKTPETALAVVRAIEAMGATKTDSAKVTVSALMARLGITGRGTANDRLKDAEDRGFLKLVEKSGGYGRTSPRVYEIGRTSEEIVEDIATGGTPSVFPPPDDVLRELQSAASTSFPRGLANAKDKR